MPVEHYRRGSGITQKERTRVTKPSSEPAELQRMLGRDFSFEGLHGAVLEARARGILEVAGITVDHERLPDGREASGWAAVVRQRGHAEDSEQDFAARLLEKLELLRATSSRKQVEEATRFAFELGVLATEADMKFRWELHALRGLRWAENQDNRAKQFQGSNSARSESAAAETAVWQKAADAIWERSPQLSAAAVAKVVAKTLDGEPKHKPNDERKLKPNTIRRKIRHPAKR
jgi:hypothetical protein